ncbi:MULTISPECIES: hypothetical protein [Photorhabdus]|uniref:Transmembrane protein n=1 Tax=Photorhabdus kayaii TaxID=230088 RepID=A0ABX0B2P0_9GAMM|nr:MULTISPECIES: hypothetical protein [Photorhabdus]MCC8373893.1 hypothetical protein [Photorhabdus bodei]MCC8466525.1 hypothetical protein [Photorhabdus bodei]MCT8351606.1 hypothetical protein [Photorhabdus kayaii]MDB6367314.1 hypothetical protein [Photorhabdus bodei]NDL11386.1 hypothetical protein [Photorhabdus kayaii]
MKKIMGFMLLVIIIIAALTVRNYYLLRNDVEETLNHHEIIEYYIGTANITDVELSNYQPFLCKKGCERFILKIQGEKGDGIVTADINFHTSDVSSAVLCLSDNKKIALTEDINDDFIKNNFNTLCQ